MSILAALEGGSRVWSRPDQPDQSDTGSTNQQTDHTDPVCRLAENDDHRPPHALRKERVERAFQSYGKRQCNQQVMHRQSGFYCLPLGVKFPKNSKKSLFGFSTSVVSSLFRASRYA